jgi:8-oxo-dGTP pyrophosphatase MutT (NUDIX family)
MTAAAATIPVVCKQIEAYLFRRRRGRVEFLLIRRSPERSLAGVWQPVTGGIEPRESAMAAAAREVLEETGLAPVRWWALEHLTVYYEPAKDRVHAVPVFVGEVAWTDPVHLSHEHDRYAFLPAAAAARRVLWQTQRRSLRAVREEILARGADPSAREITTRLAARRPARATRRT